MKFSLSCFPYDSDLFMLLSFYFYFILLFFSNDKWGEKVYDFDISFLHNKYQTWYKPHSEEAGNNFDKYKTRGAYKPNSDVL